MTRRSLLPSCLCLVNLILLVVLAPLPVQADAADPPAEIWARNVWHAALDGDQQALNAYLDSVPGGTPTELAARFRDARDQARTHATEAMDSQAEDRAEAIAVMRTEVETGNRSKALRQAVIAQTLSADLNDAFASPEIMDIVTWAEQQVRSEEDDRRWIDAQELLYLLKTFYEDTEQLTKFNEYDGALDRVNQRVALLAKYAPRVLYKMRADHIVRIGEEPLPDYNDANEIDYRERLADIDHRLLLASLQRAADEHIDNQGWKPMLLGGLDSLETLVTTTALRSVFESLGDARKVNDFLSTVRRFRANLKDADGSRVGRTYASEIVNRLAAANDGSVDLPAEMIIREFGDGSMGTLDTYSDIVWPDELRRFEQQTAGDFVGVGILIRHNDKREIMVVNPLEGTPAYRAGVLPNDLIMKVDGESTAGWSLNDAVDQITGQKGSRVVISVKRDDEDDLVDISIIRNVIKIHSIKGWEKIGVMQDGEPIWDWFVDPVSRIAYIRMTQFTNATVMDLLTAWEQIERETKPNGLILDLRHNPGGLLTAAVHVSNLFVSNGSIVTGEDRNQNRVWDQRASRHRAALKGVPTVVLVNKGSASASEIVAGCLQAHGAAVIVGERSFGKGSVQTVHHVHEAGRLKLTTQYYRLPSPDGIKPGRLVHKRRGADVWGVDPDIEVVMSVNQVSEAINLRQRAEIVRFGDPPNEDAGDGEDDEAPPVISDLITKGIDRQLQTALLILQAQALAAPAEVHVKLDRGG